MKTPPPGDDRNIIGPAKIGERLVMLGASRLPLVAASLRKQ
jgi:hypothetical protein